MSAHKGKKHSYEGWSKQHCQKSCRDKEKTWQVQEIKRLRQKISQRWVGIPGGGSEFGRPDGGDGACTHTKSSGTISGGPHPAARTVPGVWRSRPGVTNLVSCEGISGGFRAAKIV
ncbi:hypothetical protein RRG08_014879 [Elysia crispata]|uniref:Uncharacterized protein n=1 Tax=Elysia crispata TaxID=231223 RepID=A0AAE1E1S0_9GAST|nr:hypothetical protein RRG08_014879 [Elysia crispata]